VSRDHVISENPKTDVTFIAGGKWTTWREMAEEVIDRVVGMDGPKSKTLDLTLFGGEGYSNNLAIDLIQKHGMSQETAERLARTYGGRSWEVCKLAKPTNKLWPRFGVPLADGYPYVDAEVVYACREYACTIEDVLSRRTRLAFLNKDAALAAIPKVAEIMERELGWSEDVKAKQIVAARKYIEAYAGRIPVKAGATLREATYRDVADIFNAIDRDGNGFLDRQEIGEVAEILGFPLSDEALTSSFEEMDKEGTGRVSLESFEAWWNHHMTAKSSSEFHSNLARELGVGGLKQESLKKMGGGVFLG
jgi:glycerol-3-phosphate dehydrogenase